MAGQALEGLTIATLRASAARDDLESALAALGAELLSVPMIAIAPPCDEAPLVAALGQLEAFDWIAFTSANGVDAVTDRLRRAGRDARAFGSARVAVVGPGTASRLRAFGVEPALIARESVGEGLLAALVEAGVMGKSVLIPRGDLARPVLASGLVDAGARVTAVEAYRTIEGEGDATSLARRLAEGSVHAVCFTSSSTVRHLARRLGGLSLGKAIAASLGPVTSATLRELGVEPAVEAREHTVEGLVRALAAHLREAAERRGATERPS